MQHHEQRNLALKEILPKIKTLAKAQRMRGVDHDDVVQEVSVRLLKGENLQSAHIGRWLYVVVKNTAIGIRRQQQRIQIKLSRLDDLQDQTSFDQALNIETALSVCESSSEPDLMPKLKEVFASLRKPLREVLILFADGYSYEEIAQLTKTNIGTVRSRLHYAKKYAREELHQFR